MNLNKFALFCCVVAIATCVQADTEDILTKETEELQQDDFNYPHETALSDEPASQDAGHQEATDSQQEVARSSTHNCCRCAHPLKRGPCQARVNRWYYDTTTGKCRPFIWGGCQPNENNFVSKVGCNVACSFLH